MQIILLLISLLVGVNAQTNLTIAAAGAIPGGSEASVVGTGTGANVVGEGVIEVTDASSVSGVAVVATGPVQSDPKQSKEQPKESAVGPSTASANADASASVSAQGSTATASADAAAAVSASGSTATASADATAAVTIYQGTYKINGNKKYEENESQVYYAKLIEKYQEPTCKDIENDMCPAVIEFENCGYCVIKKYPLKGFGCPMEKYYIKKEGKKGEYEMVIKPACDCPEGALIIEKVEYCPSCKLALMELLVCSGYDKMPQDIHAVEIKAECLEKVLVTIEYLEKCGYVKPKPSPIVAITTKKDKAVVQDYEKGKEYTIVIHDLRKSSGMKKNPDSGATASASAIASASASPSATATATASATATSVKND
eukprot:TRINITY_DN1794_c2_g1_i1.p1 TRINITY_DN1794_c2_g1~~TRINITY_DN1794_c2_g1_i1.p1  ORF type:complete len:412 (+),score=71.59 TRINITY_DN1794_c2_g1_i1:118-1236(+)